MPDLLIPPEVLAEIEDQEDAYLALWEVGLLTTLDVYDEGGQIERFNPFHDPHSGQFTSGPAGMLPPGVGLAVAAQVHESAATSHQAAVKAHRDRSPMSLEYTKAATVASGKAIQAETSANPLGILNETTKASRFANEAHSAAQFNNHAHAAEAHEAAARYHKEASAELKVRKEHPEYERLREKLPYAPKEGSHRRSEEDQGGLDQERAASLDPTEFDPDAPYVKAFHTAVSNAFDVSRDNITRDGVEAIVGLMQSHLEEIRSVTERGNPHHDALGRFASAGASGGRKRLSVPSAEEQLKRRRV